jgi:hypothetical protein
MSVEPSGVETQRKASAAEHPCSLVTYHAPQPVITQGHHIHPVFLQNRLYGKIVDSELKWLCGTCHDSVHAWLYWILGERIEPPYIGRAAKAEAERTFAWYFAEVKGRAVSALSRGGMPRVLIGDE